MRPCLEDSELLRLMVADAGDGPDQREHVKECSRCAARYEEIAHDAGTITSALTHAADNLISRKRVAEETFAEARFGGLRLVAIFTGATALGGAAAFALLLTLGWRPVPASDQLAQAGANATSAGRIAAIQRPAMNSAAATANDAAAGGSPGALYNAEALSSDPFGGLAYGDSLSAADLNTNDDMLFCVPGEDGTICSTSADEG